MRTSITRLGSILFAGAVTVGGVGCDTVPLDQADSALPVLQMRARLGEPAPETAERFLVQLAAIPYCPAIDRVLMTPLPPDAPRVVPPYAPLDRSAGDFPFTAYSQGGLGAFGCGYGSLPLVRFLEPLLYLDPIVGHYGPPVPWTPRGTVVVYANEPVRVRPFGPDDEPIHLPAGYSVLKRSCGTKDDPWRVERAEVSEPIDFYPTLLPIFYPQPRPAERVLREQGEGLLLDGCEIERPPLDLGTRLNFDRATSIQFSPDGAEALYLVAADPVDPERMASLRSVNVATGAARQVAAIRDGVLFFATARAGVLYVATRPGAVEIETQNDGPPRITALPFPFLESASPDGRWLIVHAESRDGAGDTFWSKMLWDAETGTSRRLENQVYRWTPMSQLYYRDSPAEAAPGGIVVVSPLDLQKVRSIPANPAGVGLMETYWDGGAPYFFTGSVGWSPVEKESWPDGFGAAMGVGATVSDPITGTVQQVIDPRAGDFAWAAGGPGAAFVWTRRCQGMFELVCTFELHRVTVPGFEDHIVAVADSAAPVAVSPAGDRVAIAARDGVFVRSLP